MVDGRARPRGKAWESAADAVPYEEFDPLNRANLGRSVETALVSRPLVAFNALFPFWGSGIYAIYFTGPADHPVYGRIAGSHSPIYVGRARPKGSRKGSAKADGGHRSKALSDRLYHHRTSIEQAVNLTAEDFSCRWLVADMLFVPMAEQLMIETYRPIWNGLIDGFGNNAPGGGRGEQVRSRWDTLHPDVTGRTNFPILPTPMSSCDRRFWLISTSTRQSRRLLCHQFSTCPFLMRSASMMTTTMLATRSSSDGRHDSPQGSAVGGHLLDPAPFEVVSWTATVRSMASCRYCRKHGEFVPLVKIWEYVQREKLTVSTNGLANAVGTTTRTSLDESGLS